MLPCDGPAICPPEGAPLAWLAYGIKKADATIRFANGGWVVVDLAIILGILMRH